MYTEYVVSLNYIVRVLGLRKMNEHIIRPQLGPALTAVMKYLAGKLVPLEESHILDKIALIREEYSRGADLICQEKTLTLAEEVGYQEENLELLVFAWTNTLTTLYMKLINQYSALLCDDVVSPGCPCECIGETWKDYEEYTSGVWPEDDEFSFIENDNSSTSPCGCAGKRTK